MGFRAIEPVEITGLTSGPADFSSGWNIGINISNFTNIPEAATSVLFYIVNDSSTSRYMGIRHYETSNISLNTSFGGGRLDPWICTLNSPSGYSFDFHTNAPTLVKFFIAGFFHDMTVLEPKDAISLASGGVGTWTTKTISQVPNGTKFIVTLVSRAGSATGNRWREVGGTVEYPVHGFSFVKLDTNKQFQLNVDSSGASSVIGYGSGDWVKFVSELSGNSMTSSTWSANNNWNDFPITYAGTTGVFAHLDSDGTNAFNASKGAYFRKKGSSWSIARPPGSINQTGRPIGVDSTGTFQYWLEDDGITSGSITVSSFFTANVPDVRTSNKIKMYTRTV